MIENFKIGSDIEYFLINPLTEEIVSAEGLVLGSKNEPYKFNKNNDFFSTSLDCVLYEGNIPPCTTKKEWIDNINYLESYMNASVAKHGLQLHKSACEYLDDKYMTEFATIAGCNQSINVWARDMFPPIDYSGNNKSAGFHIHLSFEDNGDRFIETIEKFVKAMDLHLSIPAVIEEPLSERKRFYGKAGDCRIGKSYNGVEYRSLSGWWTKYPEIVWDRTMSAIEFVNSGQVIDDRSIEKIINTNDKEGAKKIIEKYNLNFNQIPA